MITNDAAIIQNQTRADTATSFRLRQAAITVESTQESQAAFSAFTVTISATNLYFEQNAESTHKQTYAYCANATEI